MSYFQVSEAGGSSQDILFLADNSGTQVPPNASGVINVIGSGNIVATGNVGTNTLTISQTPSLVAPSYTSVNSAMSPYTVLSTDNYISVDASGGNVTLNFPNSTTASRIFVVKDRTGSVPGKTISITTPGGVVTFDGVTTYTFMQKYQAIQLLFNSTNYEVY